MALRAWRAWQSGTRPRRVEPWLATICLNLGRDRARWDARHPETPTHDFGWRPSVASDVAATAADRVDVGAALDALPEAQRVAVILSDVCGLTGREVARVTGCPLGTALARIHRGRLTLAARLGEVKPSKTRQGGGGDATRS